jgi:formylglycine-generating enzyme required for sulfatase activity
LLEVPTYDKFEFREELISLGATLRNRNRKCEDIKMKKPFFSAFLFAFLFSALISGCVNQSKITAPAPGTHKTFAAEGASFDMIYVPAKSFFTGTDDSGTATVKKGFWICETELTYKLWKKVWNWATKERGYNFANPGIIGSDGAGSDLQPATTLNWRDSIVWSNAVTEWLNAKSGSAFTCVYRKGGNPIRDARGNNADQTDNVAPDIYATGFRMPSSDEWELASRFILDANDDGDIKDKGEYYPGNFASGSGASVDDAAQTARVSVFLAGMTSAVKSKEPNALGIYDMSGNVDEWCFDAYPGAGKYARIARGGSWIVNAEGIELGLTVRHDPYTENSFIGLRIAQNR